MVGARGSIRQDGAPAAIAERILASDAFYDFVDSAPPANLKTSGTIRHPHQPSGHPRGH
jgi:hypothetical protein